MNGGEKKRDVLGIVGWAIGIALTVLFGLPGLIDMAGFETRGILAPFLGDALAALGILAPFGLFAGGFVVGWLFKRHFAKRAMAAAALERDAAVAKAEAERDEKVSVAKVERDKAAAKEARLTGENDALRGDLGVLKAEAEWYKAKLAEGGTVMTEEQRRAEFEGWLSENTASDEDVDGMFDGAADAAKLGCSVDEVRSLGQDVRRTLHLITEEDAAALRDYRSKCLTVLSEDGGFPTWPCNSAGGIPSEFFPAIAIDMRNIDRLVSAGLVGASSRIPISGSSELLVRLGDREYGITSKSMLTIKTTGERTESAFFYPLTDAGLKLAALCDVTTVDGFAESAMSYLASNRMRLTVRA